VAWRASGSTILHCLRDRVRSPMPRRSVVGRNSWRPGLRRWLCLPVVLPDAWVHQDGPGVRRPLPAPKLTRTLGWYKLKGLLEV
jgi:hypothetical protein